MTKQVEPVSATDSITTAFGYDAAGNRTRLTDGRGNKTIYTFNSWDLPESTTEPSTTAHPNPGDRTWTTIYDKAAQPVTELLPGGVKREHTYDGLGRLVHETGSGAEAATTDRTLDYDLAGRLTATGTADGLTRNTYTYNDRGQLLTATGPGGTSSYAYNADGYMTKRTTKGGTTNYGYDSAGRIDWVWDSITNNDIWYDFDAAGRPRLEQYATKPEGGATSYTVTAKRTYTYDDIGRLKSDTVTSPDGATTVASTTYGYDLDDNSTSKKTTGTAGAGDNTYGYDYAGRLTSWTKGGTTTAYEWDAAGNRTKTGTTAATYDARNRQLADGAKQLTYTARGTLASESSHGETSRALTFDAFERKITDGSATYTYDSLDRVQTRGATTFTYDGGSNRLANDGSTNYNRTPEGALLSLATGTTRQWAVTDKHTDLVAGLTPDAAQVTGSTAYDPFGTETATTGTTPAVGYQSGWTDPTTGNVNMAARWYQPGTGSFTSRDTWLLDPIPSSEANRYTYVGGDPLDATDPTGHSRHHEMGSGWGSVGTLGSRGSSSGRSTRPRTSSAGRTASRSTTHNRAAKSRASKAWRNARGHVNASRPYRSPSRSKASRGTVPSGNSAVYGGNTPYRPTGTPRGSTNVKPPKPPTPQNPNRGPNPRPAPARPAPKPRVDVARIQQSSLERAVVVDRSAMLDLASASLYAPEDVLELLPAPVDNPGGKNDGRNRNDEKCDIGPGVSPSGHAVYLPRERYYDTFEGRYECRATGVYGLLDQSDYNKGRKAAGTNTNSSTQPPGMREIEDQGHEAANGHLIPAAASGSGIDLRNLVAEYKATNTPYLNHGVEKEIRNAIKSGERLAISVIPHYGNRGSGIPTEIEYNYGTVEGGMMKHCVISQSPTGGTTRGSADCPRR
ncbi:RHS repeat-associated core domain-containing protein [Streptomyces sp. NPDC127178]|uniref:RHS repeat-associated core domain-containing protein n=1 Tax=unclassified Streptomyces TaxID=2593676 RepID=UPI00362BDB6C